MQQEVEVLMISVESIKALANGRWPEVYQWLNISVPANRKHGPCPMCGGKDRFRMDDKQGEGTWICNQCGAGDGISLVQEYNNCDFVTAINLCADALGIQDYDAIKRQDNERRYQAKQLQQSAEAAKQKQEQNAITASKASEIIAHCDKADSMHPYLVKKQINVNSALQCFKRVEVETKSGRMMSIQGFLVIPMINDRKKLVNCQIISPCLKYKLFLLNGQTKGAFHVIGNIKDGQLILVAEGYATGATVHELTDMAVVVAFTADNLLIVVESIIYDYPHSKVVIMGDNDWHLEDPTKYKKPLNKGKYKAAQAASKTGARLMFPDWARGVTDFNDQYVIHGKGININKLMEMVI